MLTSQGILTLNDDDKDSQNNLAERFNRMSSSNELGKSLEKSDAIKEW